jgi:hypothetical protein
MIDDIECYESGKLTPSETKRIKEKLIEKFPKKSTYKIEYYNRIFGESGKDRLVVDATKVAKLIKSTAGIVQLELKSSYMTKRFAKLVKKII